MEDEVVELLAKKLVRKFLAGSSASVPTRVLRNRLRQIGDEIGEPIIPDEGEIPQNFVRVSVVLPSVRGGPLKVAMSRAAADTILSWP